MDSSVEVSVYLKYNLVYCKLAVGWIKRSGSTFLTFNFGGSASLDPPYEPRLIWDIICKTVHGIVIEIRGACILSIDVEPCE